MWDVDTLVPSYLYLLPIKSNRADELACNPKHGHYTRIEANGLPNIWVNHDVVKRRLLPINWENEIIKETGTKQSH